MFGVMTSESLSCWKDIAAYFGKGVRTVQRWEHVLAMPVRRPTGATRQVVFALPEELDEWVRKTLVPTAAARPESHVGNACQDRIDQSVRLHSATRRQMDALHQQIAELRLLVKQQNDLLKRLNCMRQLRDMSLRTRSVKLTLVDRLPATAQDPPGVVA